MKPTNKQLSCCCFDLETSHLDGDFGIILCAVILSGSSGARPTILRIHQLNLHWQTRRSNDRPLLAALVQELLQYDTWIAHNGHKFDVPYLRTRLLEYDLPPLPARKLVDPLQLARNKLRVSYNSLERLAEHMGVNRKTDVQPRLWKRATLDGDKRAMDYIVKHCVQDVYTLEDVVARIKHYSTNLNTWGSGF